MKYIFSILMSLLMFSLMSCTEKRTYTKYELVNSSDHLITIRSYERHSGNLAKEIFILSNEGTWESRQFETTGGADPLHIEEEGALGGDSIVVTFSDEKIKVHSPSGPYLFPRNIFDHRNFEIIWISDHTSIDRYTFTNEDYDQAELIE